MRYSISETLRSLREKKTLRFLADISKPLYGHPQTTFLGTAHRKFQKKKKKKDKLPVFTSPYYTLLYMEDEMSNLWFEGVNWLLHMSHF